MFDDEWPYSFAEAYDYEALVSGLFRRPLLPHGETCDDVFGWRTDLALETITELFPHGLESTG